MKNKIKIKKSKVGSLHKALGVPKGEKIPASKLKIKSTDSPAIKKKKQFAINAKKFKHEDGGEIDMFPNGGTTNPPIYTSDPNDPRLLAYRDSLELYNATKYDKDRLENASNFAEWADYTSKFDKRYPYAERAFNNLSLYNSILQHEKFAPTLTTRKFGNDIATAATYTKPVQPVLLDKPIEVEKMTSNHINSAPINNTINPIPFEPNTYFTIPRQGQELGQGKTDYFDKKTGKLLGTYENGGIMENKKLFGVREASLLGIKGLDFSNLNSSVVPQGQGSHMVTGELNPITVLGAPNPFDAIQMAQLMAYSSSPKAKQDWMNKATPLQKSLSGLANPEGAEMLSGAFMKNGGKIKKKLKKYGDAGTVDIQPNDYWNYEGFSPQALPQTEQPYNLQIADYQSGYENAPIPENGFSSINLTEDQKRNMLSDKQKRKGFKPNIDQNIMTSDPYLNRVMQGLNSNNPVAGAAGISNLVGNIKKNKFTRGQENNLLFNQIDGALYNPYNYDYNDYRFGQNRNQAFFEDGGIIHAPEMKGFFRKKKR